MREPEKKKKLSVFEVMALVVIWLATALIIWISSYDSGLHFLAFISLLPAYYLSKAIILGRTNDF